MGFWSSFERVGDVLTMHLGPHDVLVNLSVYFKNDVTAGQIEEIIAEIDANLRKAHPEVTRVFIEAENLKRPQP
jgi:divalent metal cation (Fe/Co/Zn/Cd) transporter